MRTRRNHDFSIVDEIELNFRPENYLDSSFPIHKISRAKSDTFNDKHDSLIKMLRYFSKFKHSIFCVHANHTVFGVRGYFDEQVIKQVCFLHKQDTYYWFIKQRFEFISTHTIAKNSLMLENYSLKSLADYFGFVFNHHEAKSDVEATEFIFSKMIKNNIDRDELLKIGSYKNGERDSIRQQFTLQNKDLLSGICLST
jgi:DNA polymerase III epsilon subunit-like protein